MGKLFSKFIFKNGVELKNPVCMAPMTTYSGGKDKFLSQEELSYYIERSKDVGMVITACAAVQSNGYGFVNPFSIEDDSNFEKYSQFAQAIKKNGAKAILQLFHAGRMGLREVLDDKPLICPSAIPAARPEAETPDEMTVDEINLLIKNFGRAVDLAINAGFDGVELHGANTFMIQQFFSPHSNQRTDAWGGSLNNRIKFPLAVLAEAKKISKENNRSNFIIGYRISLEELEKPGLTLNDSLYLINQLIEQGVDYIHISLKKGYNQCSLIDTNNLEPIGRAVINAVNKRVPVIGVSNIFTKEDAIDALAFGYDLIAIGRAMIINPRWLNLLENNEPVKRRISVSEARDIGIPDGLINMIKQVQSWSGLLTD